MDQSLRSKSKIKNTNQKLKILEFLLKRLKEIAKKEKGEIIASAIIVFWQCIGFYHHGASSLKSPKILAAYLLRTSRVWKRPLALFR